MKTFTKRILLLASILLIWNITAKHVNPLFVPEPVTVFDDLIGMIHTGQLIKAIEYSFLRITAATFISGAIAFPIAILVYNSRIAKDILNPIISVMRYIPVTAFYPLLIMWFGIDEMMKIVFLFIAKVTEDNKKEIQDTEALLQGKASVTFIQNTAKFSDSAAASKELNKFIDIAKVLDGAIIEIAGNTDPNPESDPEDEYNQKLSLQRAEAVKNYFVMNGISNGRIVVVGNGSSNPVVDNDTDEHRAMNRRTDVSFKIIE